MPLIQTRIDDAVGIVTLDHARRRNALSHAMVQEIVGALDDFGARKLRAVMLRINANLIAHNGEPAVTEDDSEP